MNKCWTFFLLLFWPIFANAQQDGPGACALVPIKNGDVTTVRGKIRSTSHDMILDVPNCKPVVLIYADADGVVSESTLPVARQPKLRRDSNFKAFRKYVDASYKRLPDGRVCNECPKYEVEATFTGSLEIAQVPQGFTKDASGFLRDASGKWVGKAGFGHPPVYEYLLLIESISHINARSLPGPH